MRSSSDRLCDGCNGAGKNILNQSKRIHSNQEKDLAERNGARRRKREWEWARVSARKSLILNCTYMYWFNLIWLSFLAWKYVPMCLCVCVCARFCICTWAVAATMNRSIQFRPIILTSFYFYFILFFAVAIAAISWELNKKCSLFENDKMTLSSFRLNA